MLRLLVALLITMAVPAFGQYNLKGNTYSKVESSKGEKGDIRKNASQTSYFYEVKGQKYPIWKSGRGSFFIIRISGKTGKEYRQYLPKEVQADLKKRVK